MFLEIICLFYSDLGGNFAFDGSFVQLCVAHLDDSDGEEGDGEESDAKENCGENHASNVGEDEEEGRHQPGENQPTRSFN